MQALLWDGKHARVVDRPEPRADRTTAVVAVRLAGICHTDLEIMRGYMSFRGVLGHEFVGVVEEGPGQWRGRRVVGEINFGCGVCTQCARQLPRHCPERRVMGILGADGAFAERVALPVAALHAVPDGIADEVAVFAEPVAAAFEILEQVHIRPDLDAIVFGDGKLGLLIAQVLFQTGMHVLAVGKHADKLRLLEQRGIDTALQDECAGVTADVVVDATGSEQGLATAIAATRPRGTLVLKTTVAAAAHLNLAPLVINEITIVGSRCGSFAPALRALAVGSIDVRPLISARRPLADGAEALRLAASPGVLKVLLEP